ncbi:alpha/beta hydrolase [Flavobacterium aestivum]|uniref:alpha/beta hydrolase n=1 Tax=Flavobacterium aestivum TaxID=3003257 RepID=UPI00248235C3|nr:alpha/beta hydrolase [Flavobacterium aestivum]
MKHQKIKIFKRLWITFGICFILWIVISFQTKGVDEAILQSNSSIQVINTENIISFTPKKSYQKVFIFYPGAMVAADAYAPLCRKIAENGYKSIIIKMPWRQPSYGYNIPKEIDLFKDSTKQYILAGHSKGGMMAAQFVYENPTLIDKLILLGTSHPRDFDLSQSSIPIMKISGSNDGLADTKSVNRNKPKLPITTKYVLIKGGNHSQFGYYGSQLGDDKASINREEQQKIILNSILSFIKM